MGAELTTASWVVWTSALSPFGLKLILLCRHAELPFRVLPGGGTRREGWRFFLRRERLVRDRLPLTWPAMTPEDEFPAVPFLFGPGGENLVDSSAIAVWLDRAQAPARRVLPEEPATHFVARLIDDYADECGLYMAHHNRWKLAARDNDAGARLAEEFRFLWGPARGAFGRWFARRQVRRMPYLFSVAPPGFAIDGLPPALQPPARAGFPPTHALLEAAFARLLDVLEALLATRPFVLGGRLTIADASLYGQLAMNLSDPSAARLIQTRASRLHAWLERLHRGDREVLACDGPLGVNAALGPLLAEITRVHVPLMRQNYAAWEDAQGRGERLFNEAAFDRGRALYDGTLDGRPFRAVAKSFQARVWRECVAAWRQLPGDARTRLEALLPADHGLGELRAA